MKPGLPRLGLACLAAVLLLDQATKLAVASSMSMYQAIPLAPNFFLHYVTNKGGAFSLLADMPGWFRRPLFFFVAVGALWVGWSFWKTLPSADRLSEIALGLVGGGAVGNQVDRLRLGEVIDFIRVDIPTGWLQWIHTFDNPYTWPIFNVADSAVFVGICLLAWRMLKPLPEAGKAAASEAGEAS